jgi:hypothetical protein
MEHMYPLPSVLGGRNYYNFKKKEEDDDEEEEGKSSLQP